MVAVTFLSDSEVRAYSRVEGDPDCDELLQELCKSSGRRWLIQVQRWFVPQGWFKHAKEVKNYTLYLDCRGEWQVISLCHPSGSSVFHGSGESREHVINFMLGHVAGDHQRRMDIRRAAEVAKNGCLVPPDGGSPTEGERLMCEHIAREILELLP